MPDAGWHKLSIADVGACGARNTIRVPGGQLGGDILLMGESAEDLFPADPVLGEVDRFGWTGVCLSWRRARCGRAGQRCNAARTRSVPVAGGAY
jgi:hypothetical protein